MSEAPVEQSERGAGAEAEAIKYLLMLLKRLVIIFITPFLVPIVWAVPKDHSPIRRGKAST